MSPGREVSDYGYLLVLITPSILGPFTAAIEGRNREFCVEVGVQLLPYCLAAVLSGVLVQFHWRPESRYGKFIRQSIWVAGWLVWFGIAFVSILYNSG